MMTIRLIRQLYVPLERLGYVLPAIDVHAVTLRYETRDVRFLGTVRADLHNGKLFMTISVDEIVVSQFPGS
jgi:hypothetical protein